MMDFIWGAVCLGVLGIVFLFISMTKDRRKELIREHEEFVGVIDVRRNAKNKLRDDADARDKLHDKYND
tara:strand:- start:2483 stop:2689 length:207 start_codon:yes stop_codon:yes gene_type:complete